MGRQIPVKFRISQASLCGLNQSNTGLPYLLYNEALRQLKMAFGLSNNAPPHVLTIEEFTTKLDAWASSLAEPCQYNFDEYKQQLLDLLLIFISNLQPRLSNKNLEFVVKKCFNALKIPYVDLKS